MGPGKSDDRAGFGADWQGWRPQMLQKELFSCDSGGSGIRRKESWDSHGNAQENSMLFFIGKQTVPEKRMSVLYR